VMISGFVDAVNYPELCAIEMFGHDSHHTRQPGTPSLQPICQFAMAEPPRSVPMRITGGIGRILPKITLHMNVFTPTNVFK
jgi:hypothetical protein